jgi:hypothetical protein
VDLAPQKRSTWRRAILKEKNTPPQTPKLKGHSKRQDRVSSEQTKSQRRR